MIQDLQRIEYRRGMLDQGMEPEGLPVKAWTGSQIPSDVRESIEKENLLDLGGTYGLEGAGDPSEYDHLKLVLSDRTVEIEVVNRGITLFTSEDETLKRIHRVMCKLMDRKE
jgi:hypothetical protein